MNIYIYIYMKIGLNFLFPKVNNEVFGGDVVLEQLFWPWE